MEIFKLINNLAFSFIYTYVEEVFGSIVYQNRPLTEGIYTYLLINI